MLRKPGRAKRLLSAVICGTLCSIGVAARSGGDNVLRASFDTQTVNPCTGEIVSGTLDVILMVNTVETGNGGVHVEINGGFHAQLAGDLGNTYQVSAQGHDQFDTLGPYYDADFSVNAISRGSSPNLTLDGVVRVFVDANGNPLSAHILSVNANCS